MTLFDYFVNAPGEAGVIEGYLVKLSAGTYGEIIQGFSAVTLLPVIGDVFDFVDFVVPGKGAGIDFATLEICQDFDFFV